MCSTCSKIRCHVFGIIRGVKATYGESCGSYCVTSRPVRFATKTGVGTSSYPTLGHTWNDLTLFLRTLGLAIADRVQGR